ncbi:DUF342 domain-containing protein [Chromobacterium violaceum]|uniref:DUF342 domain-containing protein n=1 Tax=Chromobacterium violaceum TaxID=536 RepID=UPI00111C4AA1|nr:DUF342 domain-containing protein [Chromobacterium violaceum]MBX9267199.1 hypothetical protein [Chromobacterium violaceum]QRO33961.1 hypothetical protein I6K04_04250 [Chromobacterium violaceum]QRQ16236.1 hypothetical protein I6K03_18480 [Chromobacterium violaceum]
MYWFSLALIPIVLVYQAAGFNSLSKPIWLLIIGVLTCITSVMITSVLEIIYPLAQNTDKPSIKAAINVCTISIGAMGGGILSCAFIQRARILHFRGIDHDKTMLKFNLSEISQIDSLIESYRNENNEDHKDKILRLIIDKIELRREISKLEKSILRKEPAA